MKLSRLYSNDSYAFPAIGFLPGLNVVMAEIRLPENQKRDTHNLGKTTLASLIDFCLLKSKDQRYFLFRHPAKFNRFVFYLQLALKGEGKFLTIRRAVEKPSKVSFLLSNAHVEDADKLGEAAWTHWELPFKKARLYLDGILALDAARPWDYRKPLGYALRLQNDYRDVFQLDKFKGKHADWKPFLAHMLGLDGQIVQESFDLASDADRKREEISTLEPKLAGLQSPDGLEGLILLRRREVADLEAQVSSFDFQVLDETIDKDLVGRIESEIADLNQRRYHLHLGRDRISASLNHKVKFDLEAVETVFNEAEVYFGDQLRKDYDALMHFLISISTEREQYLRQDLREIEQELERIKTDLSDLNAQRVRALDTLRAAENFAKYKRYTEQLVAKKTMVGILDNQRAAMMELTEAKVRLADLLRERDLVVQKVETNVREATQQPGRYPTIRLEFGRFVKSVLDRDAVLSTRVNNEGNIEFNAEIVDESGFATSADLGHTYKKLLCVAFDVALFSTYMDVGFVHFVYHDGLFESLDDRKKLILLHEIRKKCDAGLQQIITLIDSDLPVDSAGQRLKVPQEEIIRLLHDEGAEGRLFRIAQW
jgi:uncharacterized protein YydD (DUF2326 family)